MKFLEERLALLSRKNPQLMTHVVLGYPTLKESIEIVKIMADAGVAAIELQIPFSDPIADGPTIMMANEVALKNGMRIKDSFKAMEKLSRAVDVPLLFMGYYNPLFCYGVKKFCKDASAAGCQGLIIPDVPPEEESHEHFWEYCADYNLSPIPIATPVTSDARLRKLSRLTKTGFVYCVSVTGTTGARSSLPAELPSYLRRVRKIFKVPLAVGFGISKREHVRGLSGLAEIAVVGSAAIQLIKQTPPSRRGATLRKFIQDLVKL